MSDVVDKVMASITEPMPSELENAIYEAARWATERSTDVLECAEARPTEAGERLVTAAKAFSDPATFSTAVIAGAFDLTSWMLECSSVAAELYPDLVQQVAAAEKALAQPA